MGRQGVGKSGIVNWLLGYKVAPRGTKIRTTYEYGNCEKVLIVITYKCLVRESERYSVALDKVYDYLSVFSGDRVSDEYVQNVMSMVVTIPKRYMMYGCIRVTEMPMHARRREDGHVLDGASHIICVHTMRIHTLKYNLMDNDDRVCLVLTGLRDVHEGALVAKYGACSVHALAVNVVEPAVLGKEASLMVRLHERRLRRWIRGM